MSKLNGSVGRLAEAFGDVITEAMESVRADMRNDIREEVQAVEERLNTRIREEVQESEERLGNRIDRAIEDIVAERQSGRALD